MGGYPCCCSGTWLCSACDDNAPLEMDVTIPPTQNGFFGCTDCPDIAGTYRLMARSNAAGDPIVNGVQYTDCFWELNFTAGTMPCDITRIRLLIGNDGRVEIYVFDSIGSTIIGFVLAGLPDPLNIPDNCAMTDFAVDYATGECQTVGSLPALITAV